LAGFLLSQNVFATSPVAAPATATATAAAPKNASTADKAAPASTAKKSCEDVKAEIDSKLKAKGVKAFTLDIVSKADVKDAKAVGTCEAGSKKITYKRG